MTYKIQRIVTLEKTGSQYALMLLREIENKIKDLEKLPQDAFAEWDSVLDEVTTRFCNLNLKVTGCNILA